MTVLLTRPQADNALMGAEFARRKIKTMSAPLLHISFTLPLDIDFSAYQACIITSQHSVPSLVHAPKSLPLLAVGDMTAKKARALGFVDVQSARGDSADLVKFALNMCLDKSIPLLYPSGVYIKPVIETSLCDYIIHKHEVYEALPVTEWPDRTVAAIRCGHITWICIFSERSAHVFSDLVRNAALEQYLEGIGFFSFSKNITDILRFFLWRASYTCLEPNMKNFWKIVDTVFLGYNGAYVR